VKSDRQTYIADRPPTCQRDIGLAGRSNPQTVNEPMGSDPPKNHSAQLIEYNKWVRHEEKRYSRLLTELKKTSWFTRYVQRYCMPYNGNSTYDGFIQSSPQKGNASSAIAQFNVGEFTHRLLGGPPDVECDVGLMLDKLVSSELETTRLTEDEVCNGCWLTMEQALLRHKKPPLSDIDTCSERTSTQQSMAFEYTVSMRGRKISRSTVIEEIQTARSNLSESNGSKSLNVNRLWLEVGETYSKFSECDSTAAISSAGPKASRRIGNLSLGTRWHRSILPIPWDSIMVESVRLVLQRWRGVCSFSQTMRSNQSIEKHQNVYPLCTKKRSRPGE